MSMKQWWNDADREKPKHSEKSLSLHGGMPMINRLSHGVAGTHCAGDRMSPAVRLDAFENSLRSISVHCHQSNPDSSIVQCVI
jgi:hypothetical protein